MPFEPLTFLVLVLLGGVIAVDGTSLGQFMISRPFVAATLAGLVVGDPVSGAALGLMLEAFHLTVLPVGAAKYPEGGPAAVAGSAVYASAASPASAMVLTILLVLLLEYVGGESVRHLRQMNVKLVTVEHRPQLSARLLERRHWMAIGLDFLRGCVLVAGGVVVVSLASTYLYPLWGFGEELPQLLLIGIVAGLLVSAVALVGSRLWFALAGAAVTVALLLFQQ
jgi:PTS system mannose-specific IIC component